MASESRTSQFAKVHKALKKHYKPVSPDSQRLVLEHLVFACCLEDAHYEPAEEGYAALVHTFFDWNEIRVTSISELSEVMSALPDSRTAAHRVKRVLQSVFEAMYSFDLEDQRKKNLGPTVKWLKKIDGTTNFSIAYVVQSALGGHAIPVDSGVLKALHVVGLITDKDVQEGLVPGLERAVSKAKGIEFGSMLHQLGADFTANPYSPALRKILLQIDPDCEARLPKRRAGKTAPEKRAAKPPPQAEAGSPEKTREKEKTNRPRRKKPDAGRRKTAAEAAPSDTEDLSKRKPR